jgi:WD40 repeat protein
VSPTPLADRIVEVIADLGEDTNPRYRYGSGCIVVGRTVLTAAHVVTGAVSVQVRDARKVEYEARLDSKFVGDAGGPGPDLALVEFDTPKIDLPPMGLGAVDRDSLSGDPVERCHAIGYPTFMEHESPDGDLIRDTVDACGQVSVLSRLVAGLLSLQVTSTPKKLPPKDVALGDSPWSGISGGPLVADGELLGVVTEHAAREGSSAITVTPLTALEVDPAHPGWGRGVSHPSMWWERLGISGLDDLRLLPTQRHQRKPAYSATVREIHSRTKLLLGRQNELSQITAFATGSEGYRWIVGGAWAGKTSLLAEAVAATLPVQVDIVSYFLSRREADADSARFLEAVVPQLAYFCNQDAPAADLGQFRTLWEQAVERANTEDRHLLLVVDGLDEDLRPPGLPSVAAMLPSRASGRAHVLVGSRPHPELPTDIPVGHSLKSTQPTELEPFAGSQALADLGKQEIDDLMRRDRNDDGLAAEVLGLFTAAAGPLAVKDLATMTEVAPQSATLTRRIRRLLTVEAARSMQPVGPIAGRRYQFAHLTLLEQAQAHDDLNDLDFRHRIHEWAQTWREAGWPPGTDGKDGTPRYLLDTYPSTLVGEPERLSALVSDAGWVNAAIQSAGMDRVLAALRRAAAADPSHPTVKAMLAAVVGQGRHLRPSQPLGEPGYVLRQLCLQAAELNEGDLADDFRARLRSLPGPCLLPLWTTRRSSHALAIELGAHEGSVHSVAVLPDGRVVSGGADRRLLVWDPAVPTTGPIDLGYTQGKLRALAVLPDGRVISGGTEGGVLVWDPAMPGTDPTQFGRQKGAVQALAVLPDGRVVRGGASLRVVAYDSTSPEGGRKRFGRNEGSLLAVAVQPKGLVVSGGADGRLLVWNPATPGRAGPVKLGSHHGPIQAVAVLPDGRIVSGGTDGRLLVWNPATARRTGPVELGSHHGPIQALAVLPDGRIVSGGTDGRLLVWNPATPRGTGPAELGSHDGPIQALAVLPIGRVVSGGADGRLLVWDPAISGTAPARFGSHDGPIQALVVLPDGRVISGGTDGRMLAWDPATPRAGPIQLGSHNGPIQALAVLPDGRVVSGATGRPLLVWDPAMPGTRPVWLGQHKGKLRALAALPDGRLVNGETDGQVLVWDPAKPGIGPARLGSHNGPVRAFAVLPDGRLVTGWADGLVLVWDPALPGTAPAKLGSHNGPVQALTILPNGRVISGGKDGRLLVWDPAIPGTAVELDNHRGPIHTLTALPDGRLVYSGADGQVLVWDPAKPGIGPTSLGSDNGPIHALTALPDGRLASGGTDRRVLVWDPALPTTAPASLGSHDGPIHALTALPDGRLAYGGTDRRVLVWDPAMSGTDPVELGWYDGPIQALAVLPDGRLVCGGVGKRVLAWDPARPGKGPVELGHHWRKMWALAVLPDGRFISGGTDGRLMVWDPARPTASPVWRGRHRDVPVRALAGLPYGRVVSGGADGRVLVWDTKRRTTPVELGSHEGPVWALAVLPDGRVVSGGTDGRLLVWDPAMLGSAPFEIGSHKGPVRALAVLPDGRVVSGGADRIVLVRDVSSPTEVAQVGCSVTALATIPISPDASSLVIAHEGAGFSLWSIMDCASD